MFYVITLIVGLIIGAGTVALLGYDFWKKQRAREQEYDRLRGKLNSSTAAIDRTRELLEHQEKSISDRENEFENRIIKYDELSNENLILKRELQVVDVDLRKVQLDRDIQKHRQNELEQRTEELGKRFLSDNLKWLSRSLTPNNYTTIKDKLVDVIKRCRSIGLTITSGDESQYFIDLKTEYEKAVRFAFEREEQARIKAQIREEQKLEREIEQEVAQVERERKAIQAALEHALATAEDKHSEEIQRLQARLAEAEEKSQRAISRAQMTKSGHVYVISNIGSFGEDIYKIGMTRRLEPKDRVRELGDASVPFPFDIHMMISSDDAPSLESLIHRELHRRRLNKTNPRKEFFKIDLEAIRSIVAQHHGEVDYVADPEALEYRQSLEMSDEDAEYIESTYEHLADTKVSSGD